MIGGAMTASTASNAQTVQKAVCVRYQTPADCKHESLNRGSPLPRLHLDEARPHLICAGTALTLPRLRSLAYPLLCAVPMQGKQNRPYPLEG